MPWGKPPRPGIVGFLLDRKDYIALAFRNYFKEADERRHQFSKIGDIVGGSGAKVKTHETKTKGKAQKKARAAGKIEKL